MGVVLKKEQINYFKSNLPRLRERDRITQKEFGALFGLSNTAVSKYESGESFPNIPLAREMAEYFGLTLDELFDKPLPLKLPPKKREKTDWSAEDEEKLNDAFEEIFEEEIAGQPQNKAAPKNLQTQIQILELKNEVLELKLKLKEQNTNDI